MIILDMQLNLSTDLTITTNTLIELFQSLEDPENADPDIVDIFEDLCTLSLRDFLDLLWSTMEEIRKSYQENVKCKEAYLDTYTHHHPCPLWKEISKALRDCNLCEQASKIENTLYVYSTCR